MSEQSPWGTPTPPTYGPSFGSPGAPPPSGPGGYPAGPPPQTPPGGGWGGGGYGSGPGGGYGGPPPKKSRTGLVVGLAVLAIVVIAGIAVTLVLVLNGGSSSNTADNGATDGPSTSSTDTATDSPTTDSPSPTPTTPTTSSSPDLPPPDAHTVSAQGYRFEEPARWQIGSKLVLKSLGSGISSVILYGGPSIPLATANVLVEDEDTGGISDVKLVEPIWKRNLRTVAGKKLEPLGDTTLDGERAVGVQVTRVNDAGLTIHQVFYLAVHDGHSYTVGLSEETSQSSHDADFKDVLTTWRWTS